MKKTTYTKSMLVRELAFNTGITQKSARFVLDALCSIAYREAASQGFTIPGLCRLDVIRRKERKMKNPQTGENILIAEHDALRVRALKKARDSVTPTPDNLITVIPPETAVPATASAASPTIFDDFSKAVSFCCQKCGQEIEAPLSAVGLQAECPSCGSPVKIPAESEPGTLHGPALPEPAPADNAQLAEPSPAAQSPVDHSKQKNQTIRIDLAALGFDKANAPAPQKTLPHKRMLSFFCKNCHQEIEAPADMAGSPSECPACGANFEVPFFSDPGTLHGSDLDQKKDRAAISDMRSRTIRIEVPDDI